MDAAERRVHDYWLSQGASGEVSKWGHEYIRHLAGERDAGGAACLGVARWHGMAPIDDVYVGSGMACSMAWHAAWLNACRTQAVMKAWHAMS